MAHDVAPEWPSSEQDTTYGVSIEGDPDVSCTLTLGGGSDAMTATALRVVNSIPYVVDAEPGLLSSLDLPLTLPEYAVV